MAQAPHATHVPHTAASAAPTQAHLLPRRAVFTIEPNGTSADAAGEAEADDGFRYVIKRDAHGLLVRASEWLCTRLSEQVGIVAPPPAIIEMPNGELLFGSRIVAGVAANLDTARYLLAAPATLGVPAASGQAGVTLQSLLSSVYAFDLLIGNEDRHLGNYLSVEVAAVRRLYAFDYSRALFLTWPPQSFPLTWTKFAQGPSNTFVWGQLLRGIHGFDLAAALQTVDRFEKIDEPALKAVVAEIPPDWLPDPTRSDFVSWWTDGRRSIRMHDLRKGLTDASLL